MCAVFQELTGECESLARGRFSKYLKARDRGITAETLCACLGEVDWKVDEVIREFPTNKEELGNLWKSFRGDGALFYKLDGQEISHCVAVRSGGLVLDPCGIAPEEGESILKHFENYRSGVAIGPFYKVSKI